MVLMTRCSTSWSIRGKTYIGTGPIPSIMSRPVVYGVSKLVCEWHDCEAKPTQEVRSRDGIFLLCNMHTSRALYRDGSASSGPMGEAPKEGAKPPEREGAP